MCSMGKYFECCWGYYCVLNRTLLGSSMGKYYVLNGKVLCAQLDIIGVLNGKLGTQWEVIMYSTGNYWSAQWEFRCSTGSYVLNGILLCAQLDIIEVLNGMLGAQWDVRCSMGS